MFGIFVLEFPLNYIEVFWFLSLWSGWFNTLMISMNSPRWRGPRVTWSYTDTGDILFSDPTFGKGPVLYIPGTQYMVYLRTFTPQTWNTIIMKGWFRWFACAQGCFLGSMIMFNFQGCNSKKKNKQYSCIYTCIYLYPIELSPIKKKLDFPAIAMLIFPTCFFAFPRPGRILEFLLHLAWFRLHWSLVFFANPVGLRGFHL